MLDSSVSLRLALVLWVALVPMLDATSVVVAGHRALVVETLECSPGEAVEPQPGCGEGTMLATASCSPAPTAGSCEPVTSVLCGATQPADPPAGGDSGVSDGAPPLPVTCLSCVCISDLAMTTTVTLSLVPRGIVSPPTDIVREDAPSRSERPAVPPPKYFVLL